MVLTGGGPRPVVHLVPPNGGGVDRCVRELVQHRAGDWIAHIAEAQCVLERPAEGHYRALSPDALIAMAASGQLGSLRALHAHSTTLPVRALASRLGRATGVPIVITLHDIWFADPDAAPAERSQRLAFVQGAAARAAPSHFIMQRLKTALGGDVVCACIPNGGDPPVDDGSPLAPMSDAERHACGEHGFPIAVIGALGEHKGLQALEAVAGRLPNGLRIVVLGYTERQLLPGWAVEGRAWVHGVFEPAQLPGLVQRYQARMAFFPPGVPESFSYALSDAWSCGLPVLAPDHGAMAERIRRHGGGQTYPPDADLGEVACRIADALSCAPHRPGALTLREPLPTVQQMVAAYGALYAELPPPSAPSDPPNAVPEDADFQRQARTHLDGRFFRLELLNLQARLQASAQARDALEQRLASLQSDHAQALQGMTAERDAWQARHAALVHRLLRPLEGLPPRWRDALLRLAGRWWR